MIFESTTLATFDIALQVTIRNATQDDLRRLEWGIEQWRLRSLFRKAYRETRRGRRLMLIADINGYPVGRLFLQLARSTPHFADGINRAYLYSLNVHPAMQNYGIGTQLITIGCNALRERSFDWATIAVATDNPDARRLYERLGFEVFRQESSRWSYTDPAGNRHDVQENVWAMQKWLQE